jgi:hypothetical protein
MPELIDIDLHNGGHKIRVESGIRFFKKWLAGLATPDPSALDHIHGVDTQGMGGERDPAVVPLTRDTLVLRN